MLAFQLIALNKGKKIQRKVSFFLYIQRKYSYLCIATLVQLWSRKRNVLMRL